MSEKYLRHRQSFNLSHFLAQTIHPKRQRLWLWLGVGVGVGDGFSFGLSTVGKFIRLMTSRWRKCVPCEYLCVGVCVCAFGSYVCLGRVAYSKITFIIGTQPAKSNSMMSKKCRKQKNNEKYKWRNLECLRGLLLTNCLTRLDSFLDLLEMSADTICQIWHYIDWNYIVVWDQRALFANSLKSIKAIKNVGNGPSIK